MTAVPKSHRRPNRAAPTDPTPAPGDARDPATGSEPPPKGRARSLDLAELRRRLLANSYRPVRPWTMTSPPGDEFHWPPRRTDYDRAVVNIFLVSGTTGEVLSPAVTRGLIEQAFRAMDKDLLASALMRYPFRRRRTE